ncbi:MAG: hypothetical protein HeimC3_47240 [Candidatus Heimdallarchaeota archaeon LC_3]|nr:MAG: hypothetical protein HeimC3_47240 [Candidatus Heimdallarchaeota archaeon LC_3]
MIFLILMVTLTTIGVAFTFAEATSEDGLQVNNNNYELMNTRTPGSDIPDSVLPVEESYAGIDDTRTPGSDVPD